MFTFFLQKFKGDRKYLTIVFFILFLVIVLGLITPRLLENKKNNWSSELSEKISRIEKSAIELFNEKQLRLEDVSSEIRKNLNVKVESSQSRFRSLVQFITQEKYSDYSIQILAPNGKPIVWNNSIAIPQNDIFPLSFPYGETFFYNSPLIIYLSLVDTVHIDGDVFYFTLSSPIEKKFIMNTKYSRDISFARELTEKFLTQFDIVYNPFTQKVKDGRKYSFELTNNKGNKIGIITFVRPTLTTELNNLQERASIAQSILIFVGCLFLSLALKKDFAKLKLRLIKLVLIIIFLAIFRYILFAIGFPAKPIEGDLTNPAFFSSAFGGGIVKSPLEFFITISFLLIISLFVFRYSVDYFRTPDRKRFRVLKVFLSIVMTILLLIGIRILSASIKSVILDSTLRYFREPDLIPKLTSLFMLMNVLLAGLVIILVSISFLLIAFKYLVFIKENYHKRFIYLCLINLLIIIGFYFYQNEPLIPIHFYILISASVFFLLYYLVFIQNNSPYFYVYSTLISSLITITLLNFFNLELEKQSIKTAALEINRANQDLMSFMIREVLDQSNNNPELKESFIRMTTNYDALAFRIWSSGPFQRESFNSKIAIYNRNKELIGQFNYGLTSDYDPFDYIKNVKENSSEITSIENPRDSSENVLLGIIPVYNREIISGYVVAAISYQLKELSQNNIPSFLKSSSEGLNSVVDLKDLTVLKFSDSKLANAYGSIYPSREQIKPILSAPLSIFNDAWLKLNIDGEYYICYLIKTFEPDHEEITAVLLQEKELTWNLFNFFKIFILHSVFILFLLIVILIFSSRKWNYSFRSKILSAFLIISVLPLILLAAYNRQVVRERVDSTIFSELKERAEYVENHLHTQINKYPDRDYLKAFENAGTELGISFTIFDQTDYLFSTDEQYYKSSFLPGKINPTAYYNLSYQSYREYLVKENIDNYFFNTLYKKIKIHDKSYYLSVSDSFNNLDVNYSTLEIDVFLFGVYSFAVLVIIIISTFFANQISAPIRQLTKATDAVAQGDLNIQLPVTEKGELGELISGFNSMTRELQRTQSELAELERENAWKEMAKQVAHEIKNPLTPMKLAVQQLIASYKDGSKNFENIFEKVSQTILNQIENLSQIASEFSRFAKMPSLNLEKLNLATVISDTINLFIHEKINISFNSELELAFIEADKAQLRRMIINLIRNSIQAGANKIEFQLTEENGFYLVSIKDNGSGIPENLKEKIFNSNFTTKPKGMGLGLKLSKRFLEGIHGSIELTSSDKNGSIFSFRIPKIS
ncbi:MAG: HAMP domain-containing protein [Ignavibacteriaceae bacterium]|nr:HAMP domain-containing protein [Ignavibacteriaceae bacterium]